MNLSLRLLASASTVLLAAPLAATDNPFGSKPPPWVQSIDAAKPLRLEICFAELTYDPAQNAMDLITPEFLAAAKTLRIAVSPDDQGRVEAPDQLTAVYRLKPKDREHALDINFTIGGENHREIASSVTVSDQWIVFGGLTRTEVITHLDGTSTDTRKNLVIAIRLVPRSPDPTSVNRVETLPNVRTAKPKRHQDTETSQRGIIPSADSQLCENFVSLCLCG